MYEYLEQFEELLENVIDNENSEETINTKSIFNELRTCPINTDIVINENSEDTFSSAVKDNDIIVYIENDTDIYYDDIPKMVKWLQDVYDYSTEIKNKVEYVDFIKAKDYMLKGNKTKFEDETYYIKDNELYCEDLKSACALKLRAIESDKWILL